MNIQKTNILDLVIVETNLASDSRGSFARLFCQNELKDILGQREIVQINYSKTPRIGTVRGLHFQYPPSAEMKMVRCINGRVWDVALDLRKDSQTYLKWHAEELSKDNMLMMVIPEGFAHGFQVLEKDSELIYLHTERYTPDDEGGVNPLDKTISIKWPMEVKELSERDSSRPILNEEFQGLVV